MSNRKKDLEILLETVPGWKVLKYYSGYWRMSCMKGELLRTFTADSAIEAVELAVSWVEGEGEEG